MDIEIKMNVPAAKAKRETVKLFETLAKNARVDQLGSLVRWAEKKSPAELQNSLDTLIKHLDSI